MSIGQEGDVRPYRKLRHTDYYASKAAVKAAKRDARANPVYPKCITCGAPITGQNYNGRDFRCHNEPL